jgi:hypothetical protein
MIIDFQISDALLTGVLRNSFQATPICIPDIVNGIMLDHVEVSLPTLKTVSDNNVSVRLADGTTTNILGSRLQVSAPITLFIATEAAVRSGGLNGPSSYFAQIPVTLTFELRGELQTDNNSVVTGAGLRLSFVKKQVAAQADLPPDIDAQLDGELAAMDLWSPIDLAPLVDTLDSPLEIGNIGVALKAGGSLVVVRIEINGIASLATVLWEAFYAGDMSDNLQGKDWAIVLDGRMLAEVAAKRLGDGIKEQTHKPDDPFLRLDSGPLARWQPMGSTPAIALSLECTLVDACPLTDGDIGVGFTGNIVFKIVKQDGATLLRSVIHLDRNLNDGEVVICGLAFGFLALAADAALGGILGIMGPMVGAIGIFLVGFIGVIMGASEKGSGTLPSTDEDCVQTSSPGDDFIEVTCTAPLDLAVISLLGTLTPEEAIGVPEGLVIRGTSKVEPLTKKLQVFPTPLAWQSNLNCNTKSVDNSVVGEVRLVDSGFAAQLAVCGVDVVDDDLGFFSVNQTDITLVKAGFDPAKEPAYDVHPPYPLHILVRSSAGARFIDLGTLPPHPPGPDHDQLMKAIAANCLKAYDRFWQGRYNPRWSVDPGPEGKGLHDWQIAVTGLPELDEITLAGEGGQVLDRAIVDRRGSVLLGAVVPPGGAGELAVVRTAHAPGSLHLEPGDQTHFLRVSQRLLVERDQIVLPGVCLDLAALTSRLRLLVAVTETGLHAYDTGARGAPLRAQVLLGGLRTIEARGRSILVHGESGLHVMTADDSGQLRSVASREVSASDVAVAANRVYAIVGEKIIAYDLNLRKVGVVPPQRASEFRWASRRGLQAAGREDLGTSLRETQEKLTMSRHTSTPAPSSPSSVFRGMRGRDWWAPVLTLGHIWARLAVNRTSVTLYRSGGSATN